MARPTSRSAVDRRTGSPRLAANLTNRLNPSAASRCGSANSAATRRPILVPNTSGNTTVNPGKQRSPEMPCYAAEVPTVFVSLNMPNHVIDILMVKTAINAHNPTPEVIRSLVAKLVGRSPFLGTHNDNVWCGSWDTRR
jgi:hypothetical protein